MNQMLIINWVNNVNWPLQRDSEADVSSVSPSSERIKELWVVCGLYTERWSYAIGWCLYYWLVLLLTHISFLLFSENCILLL